MSGLSREDRARLEGLLQVVRDDVPHDPQGQANADALTRALALIDQREKALEAADELADSITDEVLSGASWTGVLKAAIAYRSARSTSTKEDGC